MKVDVIRYVSNSSIKRTNGFMLNTSQSITLFSYLVFWCNILSKWCIMTNSLFLISEDFDQYLIWHFYLHMPLINPPQVLDISCVGTSNYYLFDDVLLLSAKLYYNHFCFVKLYRKRSLCNRTLQKGGFPPTV